MKILCWFISLSALVLWGIARLKHPENMDFPHHFFLLKYSWDIFFLNFAILMFIFPFLLNKRLIDSNYYDEDNIGKAKTIVVIYTIMLPGVVLVSIAGLLAKIIPAVLIMILFGYMYIKNCYIFFIKRSN